MEIKAIETGFIYTVKTKSLHVRFMRDNVTAIVYVNNRGSIKSGTGNNITCRIWNFYIENKLWVAAAHIPDKNNIEADQLSTMLQDATEWKLHPELFHKIADKFGKPGIDLFASSLVKVCALASRIKGYSS